MIRRAILTDNPPSGDYFLSPTGVSWSVRRSVGQDAAMGISAGERNKTTAVAALRSLAKSDESDAWETVGTGVFWLIQRYRRPHAAGGD